MELRIRDSQGFVDDGFGYWLLPRIKSKLISNISRYKTVNWDKYLTESENLNRLYKKEYKVSDIIIFAANNLVCNGSDGDISIQFDNTKFVPGFDRIRLSTIVKLVNYGTLDMKACPIFTDTFHYFANNIDSYVGLYYRL